MRLLCWLSRKCRTFRNFLGYSIYTVSCFPENLILYFFANLPPVRSSECVIQSQDPGIVGLLDRIQIRVAVMFDDAAKLQGPPEGDW